LLAKGGFSIRQWTSNEKRVIDDLGSEALHTNFTLNGNYTLKALDMTWSAQDENCTTYHTRLMHKTIYRNVVS